jgi:uncharacterized OsmC-like protein
MGAADGDTERRRYAMTDGDLREYRAEARSTETFGRVLCNAREHHFVIDGPVWNGCPGEALTPGEAFMASIAACGVELVEVIVADDGLSVGSVRVSIHGTVDRDDPVREDVTVFNRAWIGYEIAGLNDKQAASVVDGVKRRCPLYGSLAASTPELVVDVSTEAR